MGRQRFQRPVCRYCRWSHFRLNPLQSFVGVELSQYIVQTSNAIESKAAHRAEEVYCLTGRC